jgi:hypothetical protein
MPKLVLILLDRPQRLTKEQLDKLADIFINVGTLFFGSLVVPQFIPGIDKIGFKLVLIGLVFSIGFWSAAIFSVRRAKP